MIYKDSVSLRQSFPNLVVPAISQKTNTLMRSFLDVMARGFTKGSRMRVKIYYVRRFNFGKSYMGIGA